MVTRYGSAQSSEPFMAATAAGETVLAWSVMENDSYNLYGQIFDANGNLSGDVFLINTEFNGYTHYPNVLKLSNGKLAVVWEGTGGTDTSLSGIQARLFDENNAPTGTQFTLNTYTSSNQQEPSAAALTGGGFAAAWKSIGYGADTFSSGVYGRVMGSDGAAVCDEFLVNTYTGGRFSALFGPQESQETPAVAGLSNGDFVVAWESYQDGDVWGIYGQRFGPDCAKKGNEFRINTTTAGNQLIPRIAALSGGGFVVAWQSAHSGNFDGMAQIYANDGTTVGSEFSLSAETAGSQGKPFVAPLSNGGFIALWETLGTDGGAGYGVSGRQFKADGTPASEDFQVNVGNSGEESMPMAAPLDGGGFWAVWQYYSGWETQINGLVRQRFGAVGSAPRAGISWQGDFNRMNGTVSFVAGGFNIDQIKYALDNGGFSSAVDVTAPLSLIEVTTGAHDFLVIGRNSSGNWQAEGDAVTLPFFMENGAAGGGDSKPAVTTVAASSITTTSATLGGDITAEGNSAVTARGVYYDTSSGIDENDTHEAMGSGAGAFSKEISFSSGTTYYFRAYATNIFGTSWGTEQSFTTPTPAPEIDITGNGQSIATGDASPSEADHTNFGSAMVDSGTVSRTFTIANSGTADLTMSGLAEKVVLADGTHFSVTTQPDTRTLAPGESTTFTIQFAPSASGEQTDTISLSNNDDDENPYTFTIQGTGTVPEPEIDISGNGQSIANGDISPSADDHTDFGSAVADGGTVARTFTISNTGTADLTMSGGATKVALSDETHFTVTTQPDTQTLSPGGSATFTIQFDPTAIGEFTATVSISNNDADENPYTFAIKGTGAVTPGPEMDVSGNGRSIANGDATPSAADHTDFGGTGVDGVTISRSFTITNSGTEDLVLSGSPIVALASSTHFSVTSQAVSPVGVGGTTTFAVLFNPASVGTFSTTVSIANDDADESPYTFTIQGEGTAAPVIPDTDGDGIPDTWEIANGLDPNDADDADQDKDGDGYTNIQEYQGGTDPSNPTSSPTGISPLAAVIPTLSNWGMISMALFIGTVVVWRRNRSHLTRPLRSPAG